MIRTRLIATLLTTTMAASLPGSVAAQDEPAGPEGAGWALSSYLAGDETLAVPFAVAATLRLEGGQTSGSGGCNAFTGTYELDGASLTFSDELTRTLKLCADEIQAVEDAYLAALPDVTGWVIVDGGLQLSDALDDVILTFEVPDISLTSGQLAALVSTLDGLQAEIDTLRRDMRRLNVDKLRERIKVLESETKKLKEQLAAVEKAPKTEGSTTRPSTFSSAEKILLEGIPPRISSRCAPQRSSLPKGTKAAVTCTPNTSAVTSVIYYLLEGESAAAAFGNTMDTFNVPEAASESETCEFGKKSRRIWIGRGWQSEGCYRTGGRAEVRFVDNATDCKQLKVGGKRLKSPAFYIALQGTDTDVARVHQWATGSPSGGSSQITSITRPIERPNERVSPSCPT